MSNKIITATPELSGARQTCSRCGNALTPVEYYTGTVVSSGSAQISYNTMQTQTTYRNVTRHTGGLCRRCDKERQCKIAKLWIAIGVIGLLLALVGVLMTVGVIQYDTFKYGGIEICLITFGGLAFLIGFLYVIIVFSINPASNINYITLYSTFIARLQKEKQMTPGLAYLSSDAAAKLRIIR